MCAGALSAVLPLYMRCTCGWQAKSRVVAEAEGALLELATRVDELQASTVRAAGGEGAGGRDLPVCVGAETPHSSQKSRALALWPRL